MITLFCTHSISFLLHLKSHFISLSLQTTALIFHITASNHPPPTTTNFRNPIFQFNLLISSFTSFPSCYKSDRIQVSSRARKQQFIQKSLHRTSPLKLLVSTTPQQNRLNKLLFFTSSNIEVLRATVGYMHIFFVVDNSLTTNCENIVRLQV